jgi:hypothetical protein
MDEETAYAAERECVSVLTQYFRHVDRHGFENAVALFSPNVD